MKRLFLILFIFCSLLFAQNNLVDQSVTIQETYNDFADVDYSHSVTYCPEFSPVQSIAYADYDLEWDNGSSWERVEYNKWDNQT